MKILQKYKCCNIQTKATIWYLVCNFLQKAISIISTPVFTRLMSTNEYGDYNIFVSWQSFLLVILTLNMFGGYFVSGLIKRSESIDEFVTALYGLLLALMFFWGIIYIIFLDKWNEMLGLKTIHVFALFLLVWTQEIYNCWTAVQRVKYSYKPIVFFTIAMSIVRFVICITLVVFFDDKVTARIVGWAIVEFLFCIVVFYLQIKDSKVLYSKEVWWSALKNCIPLVPHYLSGTILVSADRVMIGKLCDASKTGIYSLAYSISMLTLVLSNSLHQTLEPLVNEKIKQRRIEEIEVIVYPLWICVAIIGVLLILIAPELVIVFAPSDYYEAIWIIPAISLSTFFIFSYGVFAVFEFYYEKNKYTTCATVIVGGVNLLLNYLLIPQYGYYAAAYTTLICYIMLAFLHFLFMLHICKSELNCKSPFSLGRFLLISVVYVTCGLLSSLLYKTRMIRFGVFVFCLLILGVVINKAILNRSTIKRF